MARASVLALVLFSNLQCTLSVDADREQCVSTADCRKRGKAFSEAVCQASLCVPEPAWACLVNESSPAVGEGPVTVRLPIINIIDRKPIAGVTVQAYQKIDAECRRPQGEAVISDDDGIIELELEAGFDGFLALSGTGIGESYYFVNPPVQSSATLPPLALASSELVGALLGDVGKTFDPTRGIVVITAEDCTGRPASGISYVSSVVDEETQTFYSVEGLPTIDGSVTDSSGYGGIFGLPAGVTTISGNHEHVGDVGEFSLAVKAGAVSYSRMVPSAK